jgi:heme exporter protein D
VTNLQEFIDMGGYAAYVWPAYGLFLVLLVTNALIPLKREKTIMRSIAKRIKERQRKS